jgi:hypothetical protein
MLKKFGDSSLDAVLYSDLDAIVAGLAHSLANFVLVTSDPLSMNDLSTVLSIFLLFFSIILN